MPAVKPEVLWAQRPDKVLITINVMNLKDHSFEVEETKVRFTGKCDKKEYEVEFELFGSVVPETKVETPCNRALLMQIEKKDKKADPWPRLVSTTERLHWLRTDFSLWKEDDDEEEELNMMDQMDFSNFPGMMDMSNFNLGKNGAAGANSDNESFSSSGSDEGEREAVESGEDAKAENVEVPAAEVSS